jgi:hypothetical protein
LEDRWQFIIPGCPEKGSGRELELYHRENGCSWE